MVDVTNIDCKVDDDVYIWDNNLITLDEIANELNTISYEIISTITPSISTNNFTFLLLYFSKYSFKYIISPRTIITYVYIFRILFVLCFTNEKNKKIILIL